MVNGPTNGGFWDVARTLFENSQIIQCFLKIIIQLMFISKSSL